MPGSQTTLYLLEGKDLIAMDYTGKSDPFICVMILKPGDKPRQIYQSETIEQNLFPKWEESVKIKDSYLEDGVVFRFDLYDRDAFTHDYMGHFEIPVADMKKSFENWFTLHPKPGKKASTVSGAIKIKCVAKSDAVDTNSLLAEATQKIIAGDDKGAIALLMQASEHGNHSAKRDLAILLKEGRGHEKDPLEARRLLSQASKNGDAVAENCLGFLKHHGIGGTKNLIEAKEHYEAAANANLPAGLYNLGYAYFCGAGVQQDVEKARELFSRAAISMYPPALNNLGFCFQFGLGGEKNLEEAIRRYQMAANRDYSPALVNLGQHQQFVVGGPGGEKKARSLYEQALESDKSNPQAWFCLGLCLELGVGGGEDLEKARKAYTQAVQLGEAEGEKALVRLDSKVKRPRGSSKSERRATKSKAKKEKLSLPSAEGGKKVHRRTRSMGEKQEGEKPRFSITPQK